MENSILRLHKILIWQTYCSSAYVETKEKYLASALHEVRNLISDNNSLSPHLIGMISDILDSAKLQHKNLVLKKTKFSLIKTLLYVENTFKEKFHKNGIEWISDYNFSSDLNLMMDRTKLIQILTNLINNALKFTNSGSIKLSVKALPDNKIFFSVSDTGIGIEKWHLDNLFSEYTQVVNSQNSNSSPSTGLGLSICKNLVAALGGNLTAESKVGVGSTFSFSVNYSPVKESQKLIGRSIKRALIIDDDAVIYQVIAKLLNKINIDCDYCSNVETSIELCSTLSEDYYSIIICDLNINEQSGISIGKILKYYFSLKCPLVALTASHKDELNEEQKFSVDKIFDGYLTKPFQLSEFYRLITNLSITSNEVIEEKYNFAEEHGMDSELNKILEKHRKRFKENYFQSSDILKNHLLTNNLDELRVYSHSIKGLTATLGYTSLADCASKIEMLVLTNSETDKISLAIEMYSKAFNALFI